MRGRRPEQGMSGTGSGRAGARRKTAALCLAAVLAASFLAGCEKPEDGQASSVSAESAAEEETCSPEDTWTPEKNLADVPVHELTAAPEEAEKLRVKVTSTEAEGRYESYRGGASCE